MCPSVLRKLYPMSAAGLLSSPEVVPPEGMGAGIRPAKSSITSAAASKQKSK